MAGGEAGIPRSWPRYVSTWAKADIATASPCRRRVYTVSVQGRSLQATSLDGCRPHTVIDSRASDLSVLPEPSRKAKPGSERGSFARTAATTASSSSTTRPIACAVATDPEGDGRETLLVLLSTGLLLALDPVYLSIDAVLGSFPEVRDDGCTGPGLAVLRDIGWVVVAEGARLGFAQLEVGPPDALGGGRETRTISLPKGSLTNFVLAFAGDSLLLVGCANGRLLIYRGNERGSSKSSPVILSQALDVTGQPASVPTGEGLTGLASGVRDFFRRGENPFRSRSPGRSTSPARSASPTPAAAAASVAGLKLGMVSASDACSLEGAAAGTGLLAAAGCMASGSSGLLTVWQFTVETGDTVSSPSRSGPVCSCVQLAQTTTSAPVLRLLLLPGGRAGSSSTVLLTLSQSADAAHSADLTLWVIRGDQLSTLNALPGRCAFEASAARTFSLAGSLYMLVGMGSRGAKQVAWLDAAAVMEGLGRCGQLLSPPAAGRSRSTLLAPLPSLGAPTPTQGSAVEVACGGEVFFLSESLLRCYHATSGRTSNVNVVAPRNCGVDEWRAVGILDTFAPSRELAPSHLLLAVAEFTRESVGPNRAVWIISTVGECISRAPHAYDAAFLGRTRQHLQVVWLTVGTDGLSTAHVAPAFGAPGTAVLVALASAPAPGVERVLAGPACDPHVALYWGSWLGGCPLRLSSPRIRHDGAGLAPATSPPLTLPNYAFPLELVDARWDSMREEGPCCLALAAAHAIWVLRFTRASQTYVQQLELAAWLDLRAAMLGAGRAVSLAWLRPEQALIEGSGRSESSHGILLASTPSSVVVWPVRTGQPPKNVVLCERLQLLAGCLMDRLLCVEVHHGANFMSSAGSQEGPLSVAKGPRARIRARPVGLLEPVLLSCEGDSARTMAEAVSRVRDSDWRLAPAELPETAPQELVASLWPVACCSEAPPQLCSSASTFKRAAIAASDQFRGLASLVCGLQSGGVRRGRAAGRESAAEAQVEETLLGLRLDPGRMELLHCAAVLLLECAATGAQAADQDAYAGLAIASCGLAKHDLLPSGKLVAAVLRAAREEDLARLGPHRLMQTTDLPASASAQDPVGAGGGAAGAGLRKPPRHWSQVLSSPAPLVAALLQWVASGSKHGDDRRQRVDFSASALVQQQYADPPPLRRLAQIAQASGQVVCPLHTATFLQWLGLGSTELQVRVFQAIQFEAGDASPVTGTGGSPSAGWGSPPAILPNGLLVYWRCADGAGLSVRDSAGCGRAGMLGEDCEWHGPLPPDDPMEASDEWGQPLAPSFAVALGKTGGLRYFPADGAAAADDAKLLGLVAGTRAEGERLLKQVRREAGEEDSPPIEPGWTVEFWVRLNQDAPEEVPLFSRQAQGAKGSKSPALAWSYKRHPPSFIVRGPNSSAPVISRPVEQLPADEWVHLALRSNLTTLDVWAGQQVVASSSPDGPALPAVHADSGLCFGPAQGLELTELRVWGLRRSDLELLDQQRQPLPCLLQDERRADAWRKVRIRPGGAPQTVPQEGAAQGLWDLTKLAAPEPRGGGGRRQPKPDSSPVQGEPADPWAGAAGKVQAQPWPASPVPAPSTAPSPPGASPPVSPPWGSAAPSPSKPSTPHLPSAVPRPSGEQKAHGIPPAQSEPDWEAVNKEKNRQKEALEQQRLQQQQQQQQLLQQQLQQQQLQQQQKWQDEAPKASHPTLPIPKAPGHSPGLPTREAVPTRLQPKLQTPPPVPASPQPLPASKFTPSPVTPVPLSPAPTWRPLPPPNLEAPRPPPPEPARPTVEAPGLEEVLPPPGHHEAEALQAADTSLRLASQALERGSHVLAGAAFRAALARLSRMLPAGSAGSVSQAVRARCEAAAAYSALCSLLQECEELRQSAKETSAAPSEASKRLCNRWACILRLAKAPKHTLTFAVQAMAAFFSSGRLIGGWPAASEVAGMLLDRCGTMLSEEQLRQVRYVRQAAGHGRVARGAVGQEAGACGACPRCGKALEALAASCGTCGTEVAFCYRERALCDAHLAAFCNLCRASAGGAGRQSVLQRARGPSRAGGARQSVRAEVCFVCGVGELLPRRYDGVHLSY